MQLGAPPHHDAQLLLTCAACGHTLRIPRAQTALLRDVPCPGCGASVPLPLQDASPGWRRIPTSSIFQRLEHAPLHATQPHQPAPEPAPRRRAQLSFESPTRRVQLPPNVDIAPEVMPRTLGTAAAVGQRHEDDARAISSLLDAAHHIQQSSPPPPTTRDEPLASRLRAHLDRRSTTHTAVDVGPQPITAVAPGGRHPSPFLDVDFDAPHEHDTPWDTIPSSPSLHALDAGDALLIEDSEELAAHPGGEVDEVETATLLIFEDEPLDTLLIFTPPSAQPQTEAAPAPEPEPTLEVAPEPEPAPTPEVASEHALELAPPWEIEPAPESAPEPALEPEPELEPKAMPEPAATTAESDTTPEVALHAPRRSHPILLIAAIIGAFLLGGLAIPRLTDSLNTHTPAVIIPVTPPTPAAATVTLSQRDAFAQAIQSASLLIKLSANQEITSLAQHLRVAQQMEHDQEPEGALRVLLLRWERGDRAEALLRQLTRNAIALERHALARQAAIALLTRSPDDPEAAAWLNEAIARDPALHPETITLQADVQIDVARALGGGKLVSLRFLREGRSVYAFKPSQLDWAEGWRAEVASYLLCEAVICGFRIPKSLPARISREDFMLLYGRVSSQKQTDYAERFGEITWVSEPGPDGQTRDYMYGVLKDWEPSFTDFPIEYTDLWRDLLDVTQPEILLERDLLDVLYPLRSRQQGRFYQDILNERAGMTTRDLAQGISALLTFDYVTGNWDRFSGVERYYGVNNQLDDGRFMSLDNGAAFHILTMSKVTQRFALTSRFSRSFWAALRALETEALNDVLFPTPGAEARQRLETFWNQRDAFVQRVATLSKHHGQDAVLCFE